MSHDNKVGVVRSVPRLAKEGTYVWQGILGIEYVNIYGIYIDMIDNWNSESECSEYNRPEDKRIFFLTARGEGR